MTDIDRDDLLNAIRVLENNTDQLGAQVSSIAISAIKQQLATIERDTIQSQQRKLVTILFMDLVDSTETFGQLDPEDTMVILDNSLLQLSNIISDYGGRVTRFMGDGFLAIFGLPVSTSQDAVMAVRAGLKLTEVSKELAESIKNEWGIDKFQVRIGINTGLVVTGGQTEAEDTLMGSSVNLAARVETLAPAGGVLISEHTHKIVRDQFVFSSSSVAAVKGFAAPIMTYVVDHELTATKISSSHNVLGISSPFVGRKEELLQLATYFKTMQEQVHPVFVTCYGQVGFGKSRLLNEFEQSLNRLRVDFHIFKVHGRAEFQEKPYAPFKILFSNLFNISDNDNLDMVRDKLASGFKNSLNETEDMMDQATFLGHFFGYKFENNPWIEALQENPKQIQDLAFLYLLKFFRACAIQKPVIMQIDDIHWLDHGSLGLINYLLNGLTDQCIFFLATSRDPEREIIPFPEGENTPVDMYNIDLNSLSLAEIETLVGELLQKVKDPKTKLVQIIRDSSSGNPYFAEELIKMMIDAEIIQPTEEQWIFNSDLLRTRTIPTTLTGVIQARLDSLTPKEKHILQVGSILGDSFWDDGIAAMVKFLGSEEISIILSNLQQKALIEKRENSTFNESEEFYFVNSLLQEVSYETVLIKNRKEYHNKAVDWLMMKSGERMDENASLIARHYELSDQSEQAVSYYKIAGDHAYRTYAINEAGEYYNHALELVTDIRMRFDLLKGLQKVVNLQSNRDKEAKILEEMKEIAISLDDITSEVEAGVLQAFYLYWIGKYSEMEALTTELIERATELDDNDLLQKVYYARSWSLMMLDKNDEAKNAGKKSLELSKLIHSLRGMANSNNILGMLSLTEGDFSQSEQYLTNFLKYSIQLRDKDRQLTAYNNLAANLTRMGQLDKAEEICRQHLESAQKLSDHIGGSNALVNLTWVLATKGEYEEAINLGEKALVIKKEAKHEEGLAECSVWLGHAYLQKKDYQKALGMYKQALDLRYKLNQIPLAMGAIAGLIKTYLVLDETKEALSLTEIILNYLQEGSLTSTWEPLRIYYTVYRALTISNDSRAQEIKEEMILLFESYLDKIDNKTQKREFIENITWHKAIQLLMSEDN